MKRTLMLILVACVGVGCSSAEESAAPTPEERIEAAREEVKWLADFNRSRDATKYPYIEELVPRLEEAHRRLGTSDVNDIPDPWLIAANRPGSGDDKGVLYSVWVEIEANATGLKLHNVTRGETMEYHQVIQFPSVLRSTHEQSAWRVMPLGAPFVDVPVNSVLDIDDVAAMGEEIGYGSIPLPEQWGTDDEIEASLIYEGGTSNAVPVIIEDVQP